MSIKNIIDRHRRQNDEDTSADIAKTDESIFREQSVDNSSDSVSETDVDESQPLIDIVVHLSPEELERRSKWPFKMKLLLWDSVDKHPLERKFLMKLDFFLLSSAMLGYFIKTLNQNNVATAYVNGMNEYYNMEKNQYNSLTSLWTAGYVIGLIPSNLILQRVSARYYLGGLELIWAMLTFCTVACKTLPPLYGIRFLVGLTEAGFFPAMEYIIGSWYSPSELNKRESLFAVSGVAASMVSGPLQQAVLQGVAKRSTRFQPFQWLFIVDGIISFPVALYTMLVDPNTPSTTTAPYFNETDKLVARERRRRIGAQLKTRERYTWAKIKTFFNTWHIWIFPFIFIAYNNSCTANSQPAFTTWMKYDLGLPASKYNIYPTGLSGAGIAFTLVIAYITDYSKNRLNVFFVNAFFVCMIFGCSLLAHWHIPIGLHWFCYFLIGVPTSWGQPQIYSWVNKLLKHDDMKRNFVVVVTNTLLYVTGLWVPILTWDTREQPRYRTGFIYTACLSAFGLVMTSIASYLTTRDMKNSLYSAEDNNIDVESAETIFEEDTQSKDKFSDPV